MLKYLLVFVLVGAKTVVFSGEVTDFKINSTYQAALDSQDKSVVCIARGSLNLFSNEPRAALKNFQKALTFSHKSEDPEAMEFIVLFGQVIAYDMLGLRENCGEAAFSLLYAMQNCEDDDDGMDYPEDFTSLMEEAEAFEMLRSLASIAPTSAVRNFLFSLIDEIEEEDLSAFKIADQPYIGLGSWEIDNGQDASLQQCKSWKKRWKKIKNNMKKAKKALKFLLECEKLYNKVTKK